MESFTISKEIFELVERRLMNDPTSRYKKTHRAPLGEDWEINDVLRMNDEIAIHLNLPPMSCMVSNPITGHVSSVFWETVRRHHLRRKNETDAQVLDRIKGMIHVQYGKEFGVKSEKIN